MNYTDAIVGIVSALAGGGTLAGYYQRKERRKAKQIENESSAITQWRELYDRAESKIASLDRKVDELLRRNNDLRKFINDVITENKLLTYWKCEDDSCPKRIPPRINGGGLADFDINRPDND